MSERTGWHRPGQTGIGGFMESVLAMMVVICGVILVTASLTFVGIDLKRDSGTDSLEDGCGSLAEQLFSLGPPFFEGEVLQSASLGLLNMTMFHANAKIAGFCFTLQDISMNAGSRVLLATSEMSPENESCAISVPVLLAMSDRTVHAAKASVIAWR
jgi:hypothetical protein